MPRAGISVNHVRQYTLCECVYSTDPPAWALIDEEEHPYSSLEARCWSHPIKNNWFYDLETLPRMKTLRNQHIIHAAWSDMRTIVSAKSCTIPTHLTCVVPALLKAGASIRAGACFPNIFRSVRVVGCERLSHTIVPIQEHLSPSHHDVMTQYN